MAGGPSTPELVAAVGRAGGFGYLAGGYLTAGRLREQIAAVRGLGCERFGVNLFLPQPHSLPQSGERADVSAYRELLLPLASSLGAELPLAPDHDDDDYPAKLDLVLEMRPPVVSFTFGLPEADTVRRLQAAEVAVVITCTSAEEIAAGWASGADAMTVQGAEAGRDAKVAQYRQTVLSAFQSVEDQLSALRTLRDQEPLRQEAVSAAELAAKQLLNRYREGQVVYTDVVTAQETALSARRALLQLQLARQLAVASLVQALGGGWQAPWTPAPS